MQRSAAFLLFHRAWRLRGFVPSSDHNAAFFHCTNREKFRAHVVHPVADYGCGVRPISWEVRRVHRSVIAWNAFMNAFIQAMQIPRRSAIFAMHGDALARGSSLGRIQLECLNARDVAPSS
jgi:hypothetical protein